MLGNLTGMHLVVVLVIVLLLFGAPKLPLLAKSLGQSMRIFKGEVKTMKEENNTEDEKPKAVEVEPESIK
jgi:sec-independent protein translocase protein TatA